MKRFGSDSRDAGKLRLTGAARRGTRGKRGLKRLENGPGRRVVRNFRLSGAEG